MNYLGHDEWIPIQDEVYVRLAEGEFPRLLNLAVNGETKS